MKYILTALITFFAVTYHVSAQGTLELDLTHQSSIGTGFDGASAPDIAVLQDDGKLLVAGTFTTYNGTARTNLARLNPDGTLDATFDAGATFDGSFIREVILDDNGNIYVAGTFTQKVVRLNSDGTLDGTFTYDDTNVSEPIEVLALDGNGKLLVGEGKNVDQLSRIGRFNTDGTEDNTFAQADVGESQMTAGTRISEILVATDGKIYLVGSFTEFPGIATGQRNIIRLNSDGTYDDTFARTGQSSELQVTHAILLPDGRILLADRTSSFAVLELRTADGALEASYTLLDGGIEGILPLGTDMIALIGTFPFNSNSGGRSPGFSLHLLSNLQAASLAGGSFYLAESGFVYDNNPSITAGAISSSNEIYLFGQFANYAGEGISSSFAKLGTCPSITLAEDENDLRLCVGESQSLAVNAQSDTQLSYQWQVNETSGSGVYTDLADDGTYSGVTTSTLTIPSVTSEMGDFKFKCKVSDQTCTRTFFTSIVVHDPPVITTQPADVSSCRGESVVFEADYTGSLGNNNERYWEVDSLNGKGFQKFFGSFSKSISVSNLTLDMEGYKYRYVIATCNTPVVSDEAILSVAELPTVSTFNTAVSVCSGGDVTVSAETGEENLTYKWLIYDNGTELFSDIADDNTFSGSTTTSLSVSGLDLTRPELNGENVLRVRFEATNQNGCITARIANITIVDASNTQTRITTQPEDQSGCRRNGVTARLEFPIQTQLLAGESVQWQVDSTGNGFVDLTESTDYSQVTSSTLAVRNARLEENTWEYRAVILPCGEVSDVVQTIINEPVSATLPRSFSACNGEETTLSLEPADLPGTYSWQYKTSRSGAFQDIPATDNVFSGQNTASLNFVGDVSLDGYEFRCNVTSVNGSCTSTIGDTFLSVPADITFSNDGQSVKACENSQGVLTIRVDNLDPPFAGNWQAAIKGTDVFANLTDDDTYSDVNQPTLVIDTARIALDSNRYRFVVSGCPTQFISDTSLLIIDPEPRITSSPVTQTYCLGEQEEAEFVVAALGVDLRYKWQIGQTADGNFTDYTSFSSVRDTLQISLSSTDLSGSFFRAVAINSNDCAVEAVSAPAQLIINEVTVLSGPTLEESIKCEGEETFISILGRGEALTYSWQVDEGAGFEDIVEDDIYSGTTTDTLRISSINEAVASARFRCIIGGLCEAKTSQTSQINVQLVPSPDIQSRTGANGFPELFLNNSYNSVRWFDGNGEQVSSQTTFLVQQAGIYTVEVTLGACSRVSEPFEVESVLALDSGIEPLKIYPNPVGNRLQIQVTSGIVEKAQVISLTGEIVAERTNVSGEFSFHVESQTSGVYLVNYWIEGKMYTKKFIKR